MSKENNALANETEFMELTPKEFEVVAMDAALDSEPLLVLGPPGSAKTEIITQTSIKVNKPIMAPINLSMSDATDLKGMPKLDEGFVDWVKEKRWLVDYPTTVFLDEVGQSQTLAMCAAAPLYHEKRVDNLYLHKDSWIVAASNHQKDKAGTNRIPNHFPNRGTTVAVIYDSPSQIEFMLNQNDMDLLTVRYLRMKAAAAFSYDPNVMINPTPRQWSWVARKFHRTPNVGFATIAGRITKGLASELFSFRDIAPTLPSPEEVLLNPTKARVPDNFSAQFLISDMLADQASVGTFDALVEYAKRTYPEIQAKFVKDCMERAPEVASTQAFTKWGVKFAEVLR